MVDRAPRVIADVDAVIEGLRKTRDSFEADGYSTTTIGSPLVSGLDKDRLLLNYRLRHLRKDGSLLMERANFSLLVKAGGAWKIAGIIPQDPALIAR